MMEVELVKIAEIFSGKDYKSNPPGEDYPIYGTGGLMGFTSRYLYSGPAVLSGRKGSINNPIYLEGDFWNVDTIFCIKPKNEVNAKWLFYNFQLKDLNKLNEATGVPSVSSSTLYKLKFNWFEKPEQTHIAQILSKADEAISQTEALIAKYQRIKTGLMQDLLTKGIDEQGNIRSKATHRFVVKNGIEVPEEWDVVSIEEFATKAKYSIVDGPFGSNLKTIHYRSIGIPVIQSGFVTENKFVPQEYLFVDKEKLEEEKRSQVVPGDIIIAKIGANCGTCAILPENHPISIIAGNCMKISVRPNNSNKFLEILLHYLYNNGKLEDIKSTTAQPALSMSLLKIFKIQRPSKKEQLRIVNLQKPDNLTTFRRSKLTTSELVF